MKQKIAELLFKNIDGMTGREVGEALGVDARKTTQYAPLQKLVEANCIEKIDNKFVITDYGITHYGFKKSALKQIDKTPVEAVQPALIIEKSALEQNEKLADPLKICRAFQEKHMKKPVVSISETTEIEDFETSLRKPKCLNPRYFAVHKIFDDAKENVISHLQGLDTVPRAVDDLNDKIALLTRLADEYNPKISNQLKMIIADLQS